MAVNNSRARMIQQAARYNVVTLPHENQRSSWISQRVCQCNPMNLPSHSPFNWAKAWRALITFLVSPTRPDSSSLIIP